MPSHRRKRRPSNHRAGRRVQIESLESRHLLAQVTVDTSQVLGTISPDLSGINVLYGYQPDALWQDGRVAASLKQINTGFMRYPGGEFTSRWHWRDPIGQSGIDTWDPKTQVDPVPESQWMDFDEYMHQVQLAGAKPLVGINMESGYRHGRVQEGVEEAVALVKYAQGRGYGVEHYFLDNESYTAMSSREYAELVNLYATAIKQVDPAVKIVANWDGRWSDGWGTILNRAGANIDYVDLHTYWNPGDATFDQWQGDQAMVQRGETYVAKIQKVQEEIASRGLSTKVAIFEWNLGSTDNIDDRPSRFEAGLMNAETFMQFVSANLDAAAIWPLNSNTATVSEAAADRALLTPGELEATPMYDVLGLYAGVLGQQHVLSSSSGPEIRSVAAFDSATRTATVYLLQKTGVATSVDLDLGGYFGQPGEFYTRAEVFQAASGATAADLAEIATTSIVSSPHGTLQLTVPRFSLTKVTVSQTPLEESSTELTNAETDISPTDSADSISPLPGATASSLEQPSSADDSPASSAIQALIADLNPGVNSGSSNPANFFRVGALTYFTAATSATYTELWATDGTTSGTRRIKDIFTGTVNSAPRDFTDVNGTLFFTANDGNSGIELWKSDGTTAGTLRVADIHPGPSSSYATSLVNVGGTLFFRASDGSSGYELWKSDGSANGTVQVADIASGAASSNPTSLIDVGGTLYFQASAGMAGLWKSDGTQAGTVQLNGPRSPKLLTDVNGTLYFRATDDANGYELWKSDGTVAGTLLVRDILPGQGGSGPKLLTNVGGTLYFRTNDGIHGDEVWRTDGTSAGTVLAADVLAGAKASNPRSLTDVNGQLFFLANDGVNGLELWKIAGASATRLTEFTADPSVIPLGELVNVNGALYFWADDGVNGRELWKSDGTIAGTVLAVDISTSLAGGSPASLANSGGTLYFSANKGGKGRELFLLNASGQAVQVKDISAATSSSGPAFLTNVNGKLFFRANNGSNGYELWMSDGTAAGSVLVKDINPGSVSSNPHSLTNVNGTLFFTADGGSNGLELWKSDGTAAGTVQVKDIRGGELSSHPSQLTNVNGRLFFGANSGWGGFELWTSDGTATGTVKIKEIQSGAAGSYPSNLLNVAGTLYFQANDGTNGIELWKSNGTSSGTVLIKNINAAGGSSVPRWLTNVGGTVYFQADDGLSGPELWKSEGSSATTVRVQDIHSGVAGSNPRELTAVGGLLFFRAGDDAGYELWQSDGTAEGTTRVADIRPGAESGRPRELTNVNGTLYFSANDGAEGYELWKSNGAASGTMRVADLHAGALSSYVHGLINANGTLCFQADHGSGRLVWLSDGTAEGTLPAASLTGPAPIQPIQFTIVGSMIFYAGASDSVGAELWRVNRQPLVNETATAVAQNGTVNLVLNASDPDGDPLVYQIISPPAHGALSGVAPNLTYTPGADYLGSDSFSFQVSDGTFASRIVVVELAVVAENHPPIASDGSIQTAEDNQYSFVLHASDGDISGQTLSYTIVSPPSYGVLIGSGPDVIYVPGVNYNGADSFTFKASDGANDSNTATISITVTSVNDAPVLSAATSSSLGSILEDAKSPSGTLVKYLSDEITDVDSGSVKGIGVTSAPSSNGIWQFSLDGSLWQAVGDVSEEGARLLPADSTTRVRFIPSPNFNGLVTLGYRAWDQTAGTAGGLLETAGQTGGSGTFSRATTSAFLTVTPVNDAPVASNGRLITNEDVTSTGILAASDVDGDSLGYTIVSNGQYGVVTIIDAATGAYQYTPGQHFNGSDSFTFKASDGALDSNTATVSITVTAVNDTPLAAHGLLTIDEDTVGVGTLVASDADGDLLTYSVVSQAQYGTVTITNPVTGAYRYTPNPDYNGSDSFSFKTNDGVVDSNTAVVSITVNAVDEVLPTKFFVVDDGSPDRTYEYAANGTAVENYAINSGNTAPRGAASVVSGDKVWVVDANRKVYVYDAGGVLLGSWTAGSLGSTAAIEGIATNGVDVWIVDAKSDKVFKYSGAASRLSGSQNAASSFSLNSGNKNPKDIVTDGQSLWVVDDASANKVFKYTAAGTLLGSWTLDAANATPTGITLDPADPAHLWVVDSVTDSVYQYDNAVTRTGGAQSASQVFALAAGNTNPQGIADPPTLEPSDSDVAVADWQPLIADFDPLSNEVSRRLAHHAHAIDAALDQFVAREQHEDVIEQLFPGPTNAIGGRSFNGMASWLDDCLADESQRTNRRNSAALRAQPSDEALQLAGIERRLK